MRTVTISYPVFKLHELEGVNYRHALDSIHHLRVEEYEEFQVPELVISMVRAAQYFGMRVSHYSIGLFSRCSVTINTDLFDDEQNDPARQWIIENLPAGLDGSCPFSGTHYDYYFFDYFKEYGVGEDMRKEIPNAIIHMLAKAIDNAETETLDDERAIEYAIEQGLEFREDGTIH